MASVVLLHMLFTVTRGRVSSTRSLADCEMYIYGSRTAVTESLVACARECVLLSSATLGPAQSCPFVEILLLTAGWLWKHTCNRKAHDSSTHDKATAANSNACWCKNDATFRHEKVPCNSLQH
jgi:hypothetical protein